MHQEIRDYDTQCCLEEALHPWETGRWCQCRWRERPKELISNPVGAQSRVYTMYREWMAYESACAGKWKRHKWQCRLPFQFEMFEEFVGICTKHLMNHTDQHSKQQQMSLAKIYNHYFHQWHFLNRIFFT